MKIMFEIHYRFLTFPGSGGIEYMLPISNASYRIISFRFAVILTGFPRYSSFFENDNHLENLL